MCIHTVHMPRNILPLSKHVNPFEFDTLGSRCVLKYTFGTIHTHLNYTDRTHALIPRCRSLIGQRIIGHVFTLSIDLKLISMYINQSRCPCSKLLKTAVVKMSLKQLEIFTEDFYYL